MRLRLRPPVTLPALFCLLLTGSLLTPVRCLAATSGPALIPQPREVRTGSLYSARTAIVDVPGGNAEDMFAARNLEQALQQRGMKIDPNTGKPNLVIQLLRVDSPAGQAALARAGESFTAAMHDEGYVLVSQPGTVTIVGATAAGVFYGAQTLRQMVEDFGSIPAIWSGTIRDWPAMRYRGIDDDLSRGPIPTLAFMKHQLEVFAAYKVNVYSPYLENTIRYADDPLAAPPGAALTRAQARELALWASRLHIIIVPEQEAFGHLHHVLEYEKYANLAETPHGNVLAPGQQGTQPLILSWFTQLAQDFPGPFLHVGADETFDLGTGRTKQQVEKRGLGPVYADFLSQIHTTLQPLHRQLLFWGDVAWNDPAAVSRIPKDMIAVPWVYWHEDNYDHNILPFKNAGIETWVAPGDANWNVVYPLGGNALDNISGFIESGQRLGSTGELTTVWNDDGEGLFNEDWFGVLFGAAAGWQPGRSNGALYQNNFGRAFYGDYSDRISEAENELIAAENLIDVSDRTFWVDPWSADGEAEAAKLQPRLSAARLHAERAINLIEEARGSEPLREQHALDAMELGARRIDFIGLKFQLSREMSEAWQQAYRLRKDKKHQTEVRELLYSISAINGRCQDLRDSYSLLRNLYRSVWLSENRPYWLDNVLVRYDLRIQLWEKRGEHIQQLEQQWQKTHHLPKPGEDGAPPAISARS